jgi:hypothetical protein
MKQKRWHLDSICVTGYSGGEYELAIQITDHASERDLDVRATVDSGGWGSVAVRPAEGLPIAIALGIERHLVHSGRASRMLDAAIDDYSGACEL